MRSPRTVTSPLSSAAFHGRLEHVRFLIQKGAVATGRNRDGEHPLARRGLDGTVRNRQAPSFQGGKDKRSKQKGRVLHRHSFRGMERWDGRLLPLPQRSYFKTRSTCRKFARPARACSSCSRTDPRPSSPYERIRAQAKEALSLHPFPDPSISMQPYLTLACL